MFAVLDQPATDDPYAGLNAEQRAAVEHDIGAATVRPLLVVAGAPAVCCSACSGRARWVA